MDVKLRLMWDEKPWMPRQLNECRRDYAWRTGGQAGFIFFALLFLLFIFWWLCCFALILSIEKVFFSQHYVIEKLALPNGIAATILSVMPIVLYFTSEIFRRVVNAIIKVIIIGFLLLFFVMLVGALIENHYNRLKPNQTSSSTEHHAASNTNQKI
jgi:uncharacterized membrane protein (UPF0182 family)